MLVNINHNLAVCGLADIIEEQDFADMKFTVHIQCVDGFPEWLGKYSKIIRSVFDDCQPIPPGVFLKVEELLTSDGSDNRKLLISCALGESRSVSLAIYCLCLTEGLGFVDSCREVFSKVPRAYPHPQVLVSVAERLKYKPSFQLLRELYSTQELLIVFPWEDDEIFEVVGD